MKIGIIVHSRTGNTFSVAKKLEERLVAAGHSVKIEKLSAVNDSEMDAGKIQLSGMPDTNIYDALIFGAPVRGMSLSAVMTAYLSRIAALGNKPIFCYLTQFFPHPAMGGNRAMEQMIKLCELKEAKLKEKGIVNWSSLRRGKLIEDLVERISSLF